MAAESSARPRSKRSSPPASLLEKAATTLTTARGAIESDPDSALVLAYDAARQAITGLLAQQGLRPTTKGGHYAVERAARAQFGQGFRQFGALRRRRNELEYPERPGDDATTDEATEAVDNAEAIIASAQALLDQLGLF
jgi:hypothetical protein